MAPLFSFLSLHPGRGLRPVPLYTSVVLEFLASRFELRRHYPSAVKRSSAGKPFRADARTKGDTVGIRGWLPVRASNGKLDRKASPWFAVELDEAAAPWAFTRGLPFRAIAALEALGALLSIVAFGGEEDKCLDAALQTKSSQG